MSARLLAIAALLGACTPRSEKVVVRESGRILGPDTRDALLEVRPDGVLVFDAGAPQLDELTVGTTLVTEPTAAAPYGLCRKVVGRDDSGATVALLTEPGMLWEVIQNGGFEADIQLDAVDLAIANPDRGFDVPLGFLVYDRDGNPDTHDDQIRVDGGARLDLGWGVRWKIFDAGGLFDDLNPFDAFDLEFEAKVGVDEDVNVQFVIGPIGDVSSEVEAYAYHFEPITFYVGPVPVVLTPIATVDLGAKGEVWGSTNVFSAHQWFGAQLGARCDDGGCSAIKTLSSGFEGGAGTLTPTSSVYSDDVSGYARVTYELLVYGAAGPFGSLEPSLDLHSSYPHDPVWDLDGGVVGRAGLKISPLGLSWEREVFSEDWDIAESPNNPPVVSFSFPKPHASVLVGAEVHLDGWARDLEEGSSCCTVAFSSNVDGALGDSDVYGDLDVVFDTPGPRTLTATVRDRHGATASATVDIDVLNVPPDVTIAAPWDGQTRYRGIPFLVRGYVTDANEASGTVPCQRGSFSGGGSGDTLPGTLCDLNADGVGTAVFTHGGTNTLTLTASDPEGATDSETIEVFIAEPPADIPPDVVVLSPEPGFELAWLTSALELSAQVYDPDSSSLEYDWRVNWSCQPEFNFCADSATITSGTLSGTDGLALPGAVQSFQWSPFSHLPSPGCGGRYPARLDWSFDGATTGMGGQMWFTVSKPPC